MKQEQLAELLYQGLETEKGGIQVYKTALKCVQNDDLREEWEEVPRADAEPRADHARRLHRMGLDPDKETPGRKVVRHIGESLVKAMEMALASGPPEAAELVAAECVVHAETKDHLNWELIGQVVEKLSGAQKKTLKEAYEEVEEQEDEHLYHSAGWTRELWIQSLGHARRPPAARGGEGGQDRDRRGACEAVAQGDALILAVE